MGGIVLMHEAGRPFFEDSDVELMASLASYLGEGLRRAILLTGLSEGEDAPDVGAGLLVLAPDGSIEMANPAAELWLAELRRGRSPRGGLPFVVRPSPTKHGTSPPVASVWMQLRALG
jgi:GAF domain-containing protein